MDRAELVGTTRDEWKKGSFLPLLCGAAGEDVGRTAAAPADWALVVERGIYDLYRQERDPSIPALCRGDVKRLLGAEGSFPVWVGVCVCGVLLAGERGGRAPFRVMDGAMLALLRRSLEKNREKLAASRVWGGAGRARGLWSDVTDRLGPLERELGLRLLPEEPAPAPERVLRGAPAPDVPALLGRRLQDYVEEQHREKGRLPRAVRLRGMDVPRVDAPYGSFGDWMPQRATAALPRRELEELCGVPVGAELYEYYRGWRFAGFELYAAGLEFTMDPVYETAAGQTSFFQHVRLGEDDYFKLGTAADRDGGVEYTLLYRSAGGLYLLEDEAEQARPRYFAESITALLESAGWPDE